jgi:prepilin-type N-terminal cleavage/methylation domain-containing protein
MSMLRESKGFSLIEILIGLVILAVGLLAVGTLQITSLRGTTFSHHLIQANYLAQDRLEFLNNLSFDDSRLNPNRYAESGTTLAGVTFQREYTVTNDGTLKTIECTVSWNDGRDHRVTFSTMRSQ